MLLEIQKSEVVANTIMGNTTKLELAQYICEELFGPTTVILLNTMKQGFMNTCSGLT